MISVIIPTVFRVPLLLEALRSLAEQTYDDFEVIVVNDGGDSVAGELTPWRSRLKLTLIELAERSGASRARNAGIEHAAGDHIAFLDDDDLFLPGHLAAADRALACGDLDFVYLGAVVSDRRLSSLPDNWTAMHLKSYPYDERFLLVANYIHTGSVVVRNFRDSTVRFDESLSHCEDWDLWLALHYRLGYRFGFVDELSSIYHQVPGTQGLVAQGQSVAPSPFSIARDRIFSRWSVNDAQVIDFRKWMSAFDDYCNDCVSHDRPVPAQVFDRVLRYLYQNFTTGHAADRAVIHQFFKNP